MIDFMCSNALRKKYNVYGNFYKMKLADVKIHECRNILDIYSKEYEEDSSLPEAVIIMMNPGSCTPKSAYYSSKLETLDQLEQISEKGPKVKANPDPAIYQIMRLMGLKQWNHVRIINLSDIRNGNGTDFIKLLKNLSKIDSEHNHSIFSHKRRNELHNALRIREDAPIIAAWGTNRELKELAKKCINCLDDKTVIGIPHSSSDLLYYYPSPPIHLSRQWWLEEILEKLQVQEVPSI